MIQYWAYYKINSHSVIQEVQQTLENVVPYFYEKETNYHLTIHPQFQFEESEHRRFEHYVRKHFPSEVTITADNFYFHPQDNQPLVICFSASTNIDFQRAQENLIQDIEMNGGKNITQPVSPHVTIYAGVDKHTKDSSRRIPANVNEIKDKCQTLQHRLLPVTFKSSKLQFEIVNM